MGLQPNILPWAPKLMDRFVILGSFCFQNGFCLCRACVAWVFRQIDSQKTDRQAEFVFYIQREGTVNMTIINLNAISDCSLGKKVS